MHKNHTQCNISGKEYKNSIEAICLSHTVIILHKEILILNEIFSSDQVTDYFKKKVLQKIK